MMLKINGTNPSFSHLSQNCTAAAPTKGPLFLKCKNRKKELLASC
jgi:hypothetical protein